MKEDYIIEIISIKKIDNEEDKIVLQTTGNFLKINHRHYITYKEYDNDNPEKYIVCVVKVERDLITLFKGGEIKTKLVLEKNKKHYCPYYTEFGTLMTGITTKNIEFDFSENAAELKFKYLLDINSIFAGVNELTINVKKMEI